MKNIETLLMQETVTPRRPLTNNFTKNVISKLDEKPQSRWSSMGNFLTMKKQFTKPAFVAMAALAIVTISGTAYAAAGGWSGIQAMFGGEEQMTDARIVKVTTENCTEANAFNFTQNAKDSTFYYKVKDTSKLTNEQIVQMVRGFCEFTPTAQTSLDALNELKNSDSIVGNYVDSEVTAISKDGLSITSTIPVNGELKTYAQTFTNIDKNVVVTEQGRRISLENIKVGDHIGVAYRTDHLAADAVAPVAVDGSDRTIVLITKNSASFTAAVDYQKYNANEFEQVTRCDDTPSGYCTVEEYFEAHN